MKLQMEQERERIKEERDIMEKKFWRMERLYNKDMKNIEKMKQELRAAQLKNDIIDLKIKDDQNPAPLSTVPVPQVQIQLEAEPKAPDYSKIQVKGSGKKK